MQSGGGLVESRRAPALVQGAVAVEAGVPVDGPLASGHPANNEGLTTEDLR